MIGLGKNHTQLVEHLAFLKKIRRHLEDCNQSTYGILIGLELFVQNADAIPKLCVFDILQLI